MGEVVEIRRIVITVLLLATMVWAFFTSPLTKRFRGRSPARRPVAQAPARLDEPGPSSTPSRTAVAILARDDYALWLKRFEGTWGRDPFLTAEEERALRAPKSAKSPVAKPLPPPPPPAPLPSYTVKAVIISGSEKVASIDGRLLSEGERLGEERVVEIRPDGVVLERAGRRRRIELEGEAIPIFEAER
ncbi:MAG: hypothetical protein ACE5JD_00310 [Candidatus Methylomirabilia bacterium]